MPSSAHFRLHDFAFDDIDMKDDDTLTVSTECDGQFKKWR